MKEFRSGATLSIPPLPTQTPVLSVFRCQDQGASFSLMGMDILAKPQSSTLRLAVFCLGCLGFLFTQHAEATERRQVSIERTAEGFTARAGEKTLTTFAAIGPLGPVFHPLLAPGGATLTRIHPLPEDAASRDHPHHRSLWIAHGKVNGHDFWHGPDSIRHREVTDIRREGRAAVAVTMADWFTEDGRRLLEDRREHRFSAPDDDHWILDITVNLRAMKDSVTLQDDKEGFLALRMAPELAARSPGRGAILNSEGHRNREAWAKRARWCSYYGPAGEDTVGVTVMDHPANPNHPSWWHVRDYGLFAVNPFGAAEFGGEPAGTGDLTLSRDESLTLRYRLVIHRGGPDSLDLPALFADFSQTTTQPIEKP